MASNLPSAGAVCDGPEPDAIGGPSLDVWARELSIGGGGFGHTDSPSSPWGHPDGGHGTLAAPDWAGRSSLS